MSAGHHVRISALCLSLLAALPSVAQDSGTSLDQMLAQSHEVVAQAATQAPGALPNGATSITETFGDWTVNCAAQNNQKMCAMSQSQGDSQTGQQLFAIELYSAEADGNNGILVLPFGLDIQSSVALKVGDQVFGDGARFTTCMPGGCVVPVAFSGPEFEALKNGTSLDITAKSASTGGETAQFVVSLSGFTAAANRVDQLSR